LDIGNNDWKAMANGREKYYAYLSSQDWWVKRQQVFERCKGLCERCQSKPAYATHHLTYVRVYCEPLSDLQAVCKGCHDEAHARKTDASKALETLRNAHQAALGAAQASHATEVERLRAEHRETVRRLTEELWLKGK
jgi:hypothetical protein